MALGDAYSPGPSTAGSAPAPEPRAPRLGYQPDPDDKEIINRVQTRITFSSREASRWALERQIFENIAFMCLEVGTPVLRADFSEVPIGDLVAGDRLLAPDEHGGVKWRGIPDRRWRVATIEGTRRSRRRCLLVRFESGRVLRITPDHRVLMEPGEGDYARTREWREIGELGPGALVVTGYAYGPELSAEERGWLGGFLDGEGTIRGIGTRGAAAPRMGAGELSFSQNPGLILDYARDLFLRLEVGLSEPYVNKNGGTTSFVHGGSQTAIRVLRQVPSHRLRAALRRLMEAGDICAVPLRTERIVAIEDAGECEVVDIQTSTGTFIANGYVVHNCGIMWIEFTEGSRAPTRWKAPSWFPTPVTNAIAPRVKKMCAALLRTEPQGRVRPNTNDPDDREAAKVAERLVGHFYDVTDEDQLRQDAALIAALGGTVVSEDYWNPQAGKLLRIPRMTQVQIPATEPIARCPGCAYAGDVAQQNEPCPQCGMPLGPGDRPKLLPDGTPALDTQFVPEQDALGQPVIDEMREGEIESRVRMLFNFYWDPKGTRLKDARWCGEATYGDLDWIDENFPEFGPFVAAESGIDAGNFYEASLLALVGPSIQGTAHYGGTQNYQNGAILRKYQEKPSQKYPRGLHAIVANGILLYKGDLPIQDENGTPTGDFTYTEFRWDIVPGRFAGRTPCDDLVPLNKRVNGIDAQIIINRKTLLSPWILAPKGSGLNPGTVAMRPAATILYNFVGVGTSPQVVQGTPLPAQIYQERQQAFEAMNELAEDAAQDPNTLPAATRSGIALNFANEQQEGMKLPLRKRWALWIRERDRKKLLLAQTHYRAARAVKLMGDGSDYQIHYWKGADLRGNVDLTIDPGSLVPRSPSVKGQMIFDAFAERLLDPTDPITRDQAIEELQLTGFQTQIGPDRKRAHKENAAMEEGIPVDIKETDDHDIHLAEHLAREKDPSFDSLPPAAQQAFQQHRQAHQAEQAKAAQAQEAEQYRQARLQAEIQAIAKGAPTPFVQGDVALEQAQEQPPEPPGGPPGAGPNGNGGGPPGAAPAGPEAAAA